MRIDGLEIVVTADGRPLREFQHGSHGTDGQECYVVPRSRDRHTFGVFVRDDTSRVSDHYDLRAEIVIFVDGREVYSTRQCVLLQDTSEYEFTCSRTKTGSRPFSFAPTEESLEDARRRNDGLEAALGRIDVHYRRFHRAFNAPSASVSRAGPAGMQDDRRVSALQRPGATLDLGDASACSLEPVRMTFRYVSESLLNTLVHQDDDTHDFGIAEHVPHAAQWTLQTRMSKL